MTVNTENSRQSSFDEEVTLLKETPEESNIKQDLDKLGIKSATEEFQRQVISTALHQHNGNWSAAARHLKTDRANLNRMAKRLGISIIKSITH